MKEVHKKSKTSKFALITAIHDWEQGERRHQRMFHTTPEEVLTETALYHGTQSIIQLQYPRAHEIWGRRAMNYECNQIVIASDIHSTFSPSRTSLVCAWSRWFNNLIFYSSFYTHLLFMVNRQRTVVCNSCPGAWLNRWDWGHENKL